MTMRKQWIITAVLLVLLLTFGTAAWMISMRTHKTSVGTEQSATVGSTQETVSVVEIPTTTITTTPSPTFSVVFQ